MSEKIIYRFSVGVGMGVREELIEFDPSEFDEMTEQEKGEYLDQVWDDWASNYLDGGWRIAE